MGFIGLLTAAAALSADAFTVAVCKGMGISSTDRRQTLRLAAAVAAFFGGFQAVMPIAGWLLGCAFRPYILSAQRWISFTLLFFVGVKMMRDALSDSDAAEVALSARVDPRELTMLGIATSIDALAVGVTFAFLSVDILTAALLIGTVTFALSFLGVMAGLRFGRLLSSRATLLGGAVLVTLAIRTLLK